MDARRRPGPQDIVESREAQIAIALAITGQFDEQIRLWKEERAAWEKSGQVAKTLAEAEQIKHAAGEYAKAQHAAAEAVLLAAEEIKKDVEATMLGKKEALAEAQSAVEATKSGTIALERGQKKLLLDTAEADARLKRREEMLVEKETALANARKEVELTQAKLSTRLRKLETI